jgi:DNA-3-methyladenine glycosylase
MSSIIPISFYRRQDTVQIARELIGMKLFTHIEGKICAGLINETEAYRGVKDKASHAYGGRRTNRTEVMYNAGGVNYIYLCYGIHQMLNVITGSINDPQAILIRSIIPTSGLEVMKTRCNKTIDKDLSDGPGKLCKAMGIHRGFNGMPLDKAPIWIEENNRSIVPKDIKVGPRIGIDYAAEDAALPYRFFWQGVIP